MPHATVSGRPLIAADHSFLSTLAQARTAPRHHAERAGIMLQLATGRSVREAATRLGLHPQRVRRCARRAAAVGAIRALDDLPRSGRPRARLRCWNDRRLRQRASSRVGCGGADPRPQTFLTTDAITWHCMALMRECQMLLRETRAPTCVICCRGPTGGSICSVDRQSHSFMPLVMACERTFCESVFLSLSVS